MRVRVLIAKALPTTGLVMTCLISATCARACPTEVEGNAGGVLVLLDYSKTFAPYTTQDAAAIAEIGRAVIRMIDNASLQQPTKIHWAAFGDNGLEPKQPCGPAIVFRQKVLTGAKDPTRDPAKDGPLRRVSEKSALESWFSVCLDAIRATSQKAEEFTDISGALVFAADDMKDVGSDNPKGDASRLIVVFSDFNEDLPPSRQRGLPLKLVKSRVLLVWRPGLNDQAQPAIVPQRVAEWAKKLEEAGASRVCSKIMAGVTAPDISSCLGK